MNITERITQLTGIEFEGSEYSSEYWYGTPWKDSRGVTEFGPHSKQIAVGVIKGTDRITVEFHDHNAARMRRLDRVTLEDAARAIKTRLGV